MQCMETSPIPHPILIVLFASFIFLGLFGVFFVTRAETHSSVCTISWSKNMQLGSAGKDVLKLQQFLNLNVDTKIALVGVGSPGMETRTFGAMTKKAVITFQEKYANEILIPNNLTKGTGIVGGATRAKLNLLCGASLSSLSTSLATPTRGGLTVKPGKQPAPTLAPASALFVPFTTFILTAGDKDVTVRSVTVERVGPGKDSAFINLELLDEDGAIVSTAYFKSNHQVVFKNSFDIPARKAMTLIVAGDMAVDLSGNQGEMPGIKVIAIDASESLSGELPILGTFQTINSKLVIGSVTATLAGDDPRGNRTRYINDAGTTFASIRLDAGSPESVRLSSIAWEQTGTANAGDISNIVTIVNGNSYPATNNGRFYTSVFPDGIVIQKGNSLDLALKGDIGITGSNRTIKFDIYYPTDISVTGILYGFGIYVTPKGNTDVSGNSVFITQDGTVDTLSGFPFFSGSQVTISAGAVTGVGRN